MIRIFILLSLWLLAFSQTVLGDSGEGSFTPSSLRIPIQSIAIDNWNGKGYAGGSSNAQYLYQCPNTDYSNCYVDVANPTELESIIKTSTSVNSGTYRRLSIVNCSGNSNSTYPVYVKGSVQINGLTYYTTSNANSLLSQDQSKQDYATINVSQCSVSYQLSSLLQVSESSHFQITLFTDLKKIAWAQYQPKKLMSTGIGNCLISQKSNESICVSYPDVVPFIGDTTPEVETYYISGNLNDPSQAGGQVILLIDPTQQNIFGGFTRRLYSQTSQYMSVNFDTALQNFSQNSDGNYLLENYSGTGSVDSSNLKFSDFRRISSQGSTYTESGYTCSSSNCSTLQYSATKQ